MIIDIKEDSIKVITDEGKEQVYIKNKEEVIEEQGSSDLTEENNSEEQKENLIGELVKYILPFLFCSLFALGSLCFLYDTALPKFLEDINKTDYLESREVVLSSIEEFKNSTNSFKELTHLEKNILYFYNLLINFTVLSFTVLIFIMFFTSAIKEIEKAIKWAVHKIKKRREI